MQQTIKKYLTTKDAAWAEINTPLEANELKQFCQDIERLFRINPMLIFTQWQSLGDDRYHFSGQNISQEKPFTFDLILTVTQLNNGLQINYQQGIKTSTTLIIEPITIPCSGWRSKLIIIDNYDGQSELERKQQLATVDKSITIWATECQRYLQIWQKLSRFAVWRWYMHTVWQPMKPAGRRITYILLWLTAFEIVLILFGVLISRGF